MTTNLRDGGGGGGDPDPEPPEAEEFLADGSIRWRRLIEAGAGTVATLVAIAIADMINLVSTGLVASLTVAGEWIGLVVSAPLSAGESAVTTAFVETGSFVSSLGIIAFPLSVVMVLVTVLLVLWGVSRFV